MEAYNGETGYQDLSYLREPLFARPTSGLAHLVQSKS